MAFRSSGAAAAAASSSSSAGVLGGIFLTATATALGAKAFASTRVRRNTVGFLHPVARDGGGGERVRQCFRRRFARLTDLN